MSRSLRGQQGDPYSGFADRYDLFFGEFGQHETGELDFWSWLLHGLEVRRVLDCACGTGRHVHLMHQLGHWVCGSDLSAAMLTRASLNLTACGVRRPLIQADFRELPYAGETFDVVLCLTTSLPHLTDEREVISALRSMWRVLRLGGILVLSQGLTDKLVNQQPRFIPEINTRDLSRVFAIDYLDGRVRINVIDLVHEAERQEFMVDSFEYLKLLPGQYQRLLDEAGFSLASMYAGFSQQRYDPETSDQVVIVARK